MIIRSSTPKRWYFGTNAIISVGAILAAALLLLAWPVALFWILGSRATPRELPNGYYIQPDWDSSGTCILSDHPSPLTIEQPFVVPAEIDNVAVIGDLVVGHVRYDETKQNSTGESAGWFILDTKAELCRTAIPEEEWLLQLRALKLDVTTIHLVSPYSFPKLQR